MTALLKKILPIGGALLILFVLLYLCYLPWETHTIFGDDLNNITLNMKAPDFVEKVNAFHVFQKFRPLHDVLATAVISAFQKNLHYYYIFNVALLALVSYVFSRIVNLVLQSETLALFSGIVFGMSHFFYYHVTQILEGGFLETQALLFFLCTLYYMMQILLNLSAMQTKKWLLWCILYANLALYTHERYVVVFPALLMVIWFSSAARQVPVVSKIILSSLAVVTPVANAIIKTQVLDMPFFVGTGGSSMEFSMSQALEFLNQCLLSLIQINHGPDYLVGITFQGLPGMYKILALGVAGFSLFMIFVLVRESAIAGFRWLAKQVLEPSAIRGGTDASWLQPMLLLLILFFLCLVPAISTIRVEQRWITAPYAVLIIMILMALRYSTGNKMRLFTAVVPFLLLLLGANRAYSELGNRNLYMYNGARLSTRFYDAYAKGIIKPGTKRIIILEKKRDENFENELKWVTIDGTLFEFYFGKSKLLQFTDGQFSKADSGTAVPPVPDFDAKNDQIILLNPELKDVTPAYLQDTLKTIVVEMNKQ